MKTIKTLVLLVTLFLLPTIALALTPPLPTVGPDVPCLDCDSLREAPYPESGLWSNPGKSPGSGLNIEIQNGRLVGYLYTYTSEGKPEWLIVSGQLVRSETEGVVWELDTRMTRVEGGHPVEHLPFSPPDQITSDKRIQLEFKQRNHLHIKIYTDGLGLLFDEYFVPFMYGSVGKAYFEAQTAYLFPEFGIGQARAEFILSYRGATSSWSGQHIFIEEPVVSGTRSNRKLIYVMWVLEPVRPTTGIIPRRFSAGKITCELGDNTQTPGCRIEMDEVVFRMPIGNFNDSHFLAEAEDGSIIEGFRIEYD